MVARPFKAGMTRGHQWPFRRVATAEEMRPSGVATRRTVWGPRPKTGPEGPAYHRVVAMRPKTSRRIGLSTEPDRLHFGCIGAQLYPRPYPAGDAGYVPQGSGHFIES